MKKVLKSISITAAAFVLSTSLTYADSSNISYQGVAFNSGAAVASSNISLRFTILQSDGTTVVYQETKSSVATTDKGFFSHQIGSGIRTAGAANIDAITWADDYKLKVEVDYANGTSYTDLGIQDLSSTVYAKKAHSADSLTTAITIGGVSFDGSANIDLPGVNTASTQNTSGNAATATALAANGSNCLAGQYPLGVDASGAVESCTTLTDTFYTETETDAKYLPLAGGTMTGDITMTAGKYLMNSADSTDKFGWYADDKFALYIDNKVTFFSQANKVWVNEQKNDVDFIVHGDTTDNLIYVDASANSVGIGTSTPTSTYKLHAYSGNNGFPAMIESASSGSYLRFKGSGTTLNNSIGTDSNDMVIRTNATARLRVKSDGNVGIGTSSPESILHVKKDNNGNLSNLTIENQKQQLLLGSYYQLGVDQYSSIQTNDTDSAGVLPPLALNPDGGAVGIGTISPERQLHVNATSDSPMLVQSSSSNASLIRFKDAESNPSTSYPGIGARDNDMVFITGNQWRMYVKEDGKVGIGTSSPTVPLHVAGTGTATWSENGKAYFDFDDFVLGNSDGTPSLNDTSVSIFATNNIATDAIFIAGSDKRIKEDIKAIENSIDTIKKLKPSSYTKIDKIKNGTKKYYGFIAQELEKVIPEAVNIGKGSVPVLKPFDEIEFEDGTEYTILVKNGDNLKELTYKVGDERPEGEIIVKSKNVDDFRTVEYDAVFTVAVDAIQEQQEIIESQEEKINNQNEKILKLEEQLKTITTILKSNGLMK